MASSSSSKSMDVKDDVDRLFACFKCGVTPPKSALMERRTRRRRRKSTEDSGTDHVETLGVQLELSGPPLDQKPNDEEGPGTSTSMAIKFSRRTQISPVIFYGSPHGVPMKRPLQLLKLLHEIHVDLVEQSDFRKRDDIWATFPRQDEAIKFAKVHKDVFVFSYQDHLTTKRRFLASTHDEFWRRYKSMAHGVRHHYEVIQEGFPCHLYFDLEFDERANQNKDVDEMVDILLRVTFDALNDKYSIIGNPEWVIELDSSTEEKFSRHLIIRIPHAAFKDNSHVGAFVSEICSRIANLRASDPQIEKLYIRKKSHFSDPLCNIFLDTAVYTKNRCFRLAFSSKAGKNSFLMPTGRFKHKGMNEKQLFMESMICRLDADCAKLLVCRMDLDCQKTLHFESEVNQATEHHNVPKADVDSFPSTYSTGQSPFPSLDVFVESIASNGIVSGKIRCWYWFSMYGLMVYSMLRNRYCERIGREHKSNHVMYVIDFQRMGYYQKCYDPDCKGYRSPMRQIPYDVIPDGDAIFKSIQTQNYSEVMNINLDQQFEESENMPRVNTKIISDSGKRDDRWWQEAIKYADCVENIRKAPEFNSPLQKWTEDSDWWMDAEKLVEQVEGQIK